MNYNGTGGSAEPIGGNVEYSVRGTDGFASTAWDANVTTIPADKVSIYSDLRQHGTGYSYGKGSTYGGGGGPGMSGCVFVYFMY